MIQSKSDDECYHTLLSIVNQGGSTFLLKIEQLILNLLNSKVPININDSPELILFPKTGKQRRKIHLLCRYYNLISTSEDWYVLRIWMDREYRELEIDKKKVLIKRHEGTKQYRELNNHLTISDMCRSLRPIQKLKWLDKFNVQVEHVLNSSSSSSNNNCSELSLDCMINRMKQSILPNECLIHIFEYMDRKSLVNVIGLVSHTWYLLASHDYLWKDCVSWILEHYQNISYDFYLYLHCLKTRCMHMIYRIRMENCEYCSDCPYSQLYARHNHTSLQIEPLFEYYWKIQDVNSFDQPMDSVLP
jgi:hypothetical protein